MPGPTTAARRVARRSAAAGAQLVRCHVRPAECLRFVAACAPQRSPPGALRRRWQLRRRWDGVRAHAAPAASARPSRRFKFAIDRGGTFTDVFAEVRARPLAALAAVALAEAPGRARACEGASGRGSDGALLQGPAAACGDCRCDRSEVKPCSGASRRRVRAASHAEAAVGGPGQLPGRADRGHPAHPREREGPAVAQSRPCRHVGHREHPHGYHGVPARACAAQCGSELCQTDLLLGLRESLPMQWERHRGGTGWRGRQGMGASGRMGLCRC